MPAIRILHIITKLELGGAQQNTLYTDSHIDKTRFSSGIISGRGGLLDSSAPPSVVFAENLVREISPFRDFLALRELAGILKREKPDIVHTHSSKAGILGRLAAAIAGVPVVIHTFHGFGFNDRQGILKRNFYILLEKICARFSDALVFVSEANMREAEKLKIGNKRNYHLVRSGIDLSVFEKTSDKSAKRAELGIPGDGVVVFSAGNMKPQKNYRDFIFAAEKLLPEFPKLYFIFAGGGERLGEARRAAREKGIEKRCLFPGWRRDIPALLSASDIFLLTSLWEGLPRSLVEAFRAGIPAVCYDADGVKDILRDGINGFMVKRGDREELVAKLSSIAGNGKLRERLAKGAAETDLSEFDIGLMVKKLEDLYLNLAEGKNIFS